MFFNIFCLYWTPKIATISPFFDQRANKALVAGWGPPQELEVGPRSRPYVLVYIIISLRIFKLNFSFSIFSLVKKWNSLFNYILPYFAGMIVWPWVLTVITGVTTATTGRNYHIRRNHTENHCFYRRNQTDKTEIKLHKIANKLKLWN